MESTKAHKKMIFILDELDDYHVLKHDHSTTDQQTDLTDLLADKRV